jgi:hypothetical protein
MCHWAPRGKQTSERDSESLTAAPGLLSAFQSHEPLYAKRAEHYLESRVGVSVYIQDQAERPNGKVPFVGRETCPAWETVAALVWTTGRNPVPPLSQLCFDRGVWCLYCNMEVSGPGSHEAGVRKVRRLAARDLAADRRQWPEVRSPEQAQLPDLVRRER